VHACTMYIGKSSQPFSAFCFSASPSPHPSPRSIGAGREFLLENLLMLMRQVTEHELEDDDREVRLGRRRLRYPFIDLEESHERPLRTPFRRFRPRRWSSVTATDDSSDEEFEPRPPTPRPQMPHPSVHLPTRADSTEIWDEFAPPTPSRLVPLPRPKLIRSSDSPILPPLYPSSQPDGRERSPSAGNFSSDRNLLLMDEAFVDEPIFDAPRVDDNKLNDLSAVPSLHQFPTLPSLLQPPDRADSPVSLTLRPRSSSDANGGSSVNSGSLHVSRSNSSTSKHSNSVGIDVEDDDNDFAFHAALRRSMVEVEGGDNDGEWQSNMYIRYCT